MGKYNTNINNTGKPKKSNEQKFYEKVIQQIGALIIHSVGATISILVTIILGIQCATSGGYWTYLLSVIICITVTAACIGAIIVDTCNMILLIRGLHDGKREY